MTNCFSHVKILLLNVLFLVVPSFKVLSYLSSLCGETTLYLGLVFKPHFSKIFLKFFKLFFGNILLMGACFSMKKETSKGKHHMDSSKEEKVRLCLVHRIFERKCKGKKIKRKSRINEKN